MTLTPSGDSDILLHQSGHIMLTDFDLAKQSGQPGGRPARVMTIEPGSVPLMGTKGRLQQGSFK